MLPRILYELLPYMYLTTGVAGGLIIDSSLIMIGSMLLISAGLLTLYMRYQYRTAANNEPAPATDRRAGKDRRQREVSDFPVVDGYGQLILADRRTGNRRQDMHHSFG